MSRIYSPRSYDADGAGSVEAMTRELTWVGNASSLHASGRSARRVVEESREAIAAQSGKSGRVDLHQRRHRVGQSGYQGSLLVRC